jgi:hypothetical protein
MYFQFRGFPSASHSNRGGELLLARFIRAWFATSFGRPGLREATATLQKGSNVQCSSCLGLSGRWCSAASEAAVNSVAL